MLCCQLEMSEQVTRKHRFGHPDQTLARLPLIPNPRAEDGRVLETLEDALPQCARASAETEDSTTRVQLRRVKCKVCKPWF
jgi:hypothetical protein